MPVNTGAITHSFCVDRTSLTCSAPTSRPVCFLGFWAVPMKIVVSHAASPTWCPLDGHSPLDPKADWEKLYLRGLSSRHPSLLYRKLWVFSFPNKLSHCRVGQGCFNSRCHAWRNLSTRFIVLPATAWIGRASMVSQLAQREGGGKQKTGRG